MGFLSKQLIIEAFSFAFFSHYLILSFTRGLDDLSEGIIVVLGFGNIAGCLIDCFIFSAANWTNDLGLVNFGCIICSNLLADNSVSDLGLNLTGITVLGSAMDLVPDGLAVNSARLLIFLTAAPPPPPYRADEAISSRGKPLVPQYIYRLDKQLLLS